MYSPVSLLSTKHAVACFANMCAASAIVCECVRDTIWLVEVCDDLAFLDVVMCATGSCTCRRSRRAPLVMVTCGAPLVIVPSWSPLEVTVGACCYWCDSLFDCWMFFGVPCFFCFNFSMVEFREEYLSVTVWLAMC